MSERTLLEKAIRKLRKKLRQIEHLETIDRELNEEEWTKVLSASVFRTELQKLLVLLPLTVEHKDSSASHTATEDDLPTNVEDVSKEFTALTYEDDYEADVDTDVNGTRDQERTMPEEKSQDTVLTPVLKKRNYVYRDNATDGLESKQQGDVTPTKKSKTEPNDDRRKKKDKQNSWKNYRFQVQLLQGHNDLVGCVALDDDILVSASRDTTLKVWSVSTGTELHSLGGHTGSVTSVLILPLAESTRIAKAYDLDAEAGRLIISGSLDCSIRVWCLNAAQHIKSIYTYSPVTCVAYIDKVGLIVSGSGGGKVELWDLETVQSVQSLHVHDEAVTCVTADQDGYIYTSAEDGIVKVFELRQRSLHLVFSSEDVKTEQGLKVNWRLTRSLVAASQKVYLGDTGTNVKVLDWKSGVVHKLSNHLTEFGRTDSLCIYNNVLLCSGYDLDYGISYINVRDILTESYLGTLTDSQSGRVMCVASAQTGPHRTVIITGGTQLKVWKQVTGNCEASARGEVYDVQYINAYNHPVKDSDIDSDSEESENETDDVTPPLQNELPWRRQQQEEDNAAKSGWNSWCSVL